jgi:hypothetical protein
MSTEILHGVSVGREPAHTFKRGSRASRSPSPSRFMAKTVIRMAIHRCTRRQVSTSCDTPLPLMKLQRRTSTMATCHAAIRGGQLSGLGEYVKVVP